MNPMANRQYGKVRAEAFNREIRHDHLISEAKAGRRVEADSEMAISSTVLIHVRGWWGNMVRANHKRASSVG